MPSFHYTFPFLLLDIPLQSFNLMIFFSFTFYVFLLFSFPSFLFFWPRFLLLLSGLILNSVSPGHLLHLFALPSSSSSSSALFFSALPVPFNKTVFPQESLPVLFLLVTVDRRK